MRKDFENIVKTKTDKELEIISKDYVFFTENERLFALKELEGRSGISDDLVKHKKEIELSQNIEQESVKPQHRIRFKDLLPHSGYYATPILIYTNIVVFLLMVLSGVDFLQPDVYSLLEWGGNLRYFTTDGEYWRLISSVFIHGGIFHLLFNMIALLYIGSVLEKKIGTGRFLIVYLASGIIASVSSNIMYDNVVSVGASGAIFGLFSATLVLSMFRESLFSDISKSKLAFSLVFFIVYNVYYGFNQVGIDNAAHLGGLLGGLLFGIYYCLADRKKKVSTQLDSAVD